MSCLALPHTSETPVQRVPNTVGECQPSQGDGHLEKKRSHVKIAYTNGGVPVPISLSNGYP